MEPIGWIVGLGAIVVIVVLWSVREQKKEEDRLGVRSDKIDRIHNLNYLGGHPDKPEPLKKCSLVFTPKEVAIKSISNQIVFRARIDIVSAIHVETEQEAKRRITATRMLTTGIFSLAIPKKVKGSVLITLETDNGPLIFERLKTSKTDMMRSLAPQLASINARESDDENGSGPAF